MYEGASGVFGAVSGLWYLTDGFKGENNFTAQASPLHSPQCPSIPNEEWFRVVKPDFGPNEALQVTYRTMSYDRPSAQTAAGVHTLKITPLEFGDFAAVRSALVRAFRLDESDNRVDEDETHVYFERAVAQIWRLNPFYDPRLLGFNKEAWVVKTDQQWEQATENYPWEFKTWARQTGLLALIIRCNASHPLYQVMRVQSLYQVMRVQSLYQVMRAQSGATHLIHFIK
eukprot:1196150-Prorocentrum_minimum.AAC.4